jgi:Zn-dependent peptidase ImmA (M78 family)
MFGERIHQARLLAGLTQEDLAQAMIKLGHPATKAVISKYENNKSSPTSAWLLSAASILDVPVSYFTHQSSVEVEWLAFRRHSTLPARDQKAIKAYAQDVADLQIELQNLLYPHPQVSLPEKMVVMSDTDAEVAAQRLREHWSLDDNPIDSLVRTAEDHRVVIVTWGHHEGEFDGLSGLCSNQYPIIVINMRVDTDRKRFTVAHELGHLVMDTTGVPDKAAEKLANRFAAALIVPATRVRDELGTKRNGLDWNELGILKQRYGLSIAAWIFRAYDLNIITAQRKNELFKELSRKGWRKNEPASYSGDETPCKLEQMAYRAVSEAVMSSDRILRVLPNWSEHALWDSVAKSYPVHELFNLSDTERERAVAEAFAEAQDEVFEVFEANEFLEIGESTR